MKRKCSKLNTIAQPMKYAPLMAAATAVMTQAMQVMGYAAGFNPEGAVKTVVNWITWLVLGVGVVIAIFQGVGVYQAWEAEETDRQSKKLKGVFVGIGMCLIKPIVLILLKAAGGGDSDAAKYFE